jgi:hypothetical protein
MRGSGILDGAKREEIERMQGAVAPMDASSYG